LLKPTLGLDPNSWPGSGRATLPLSDDNLPFSFPAVQRKKIIVAFEGAG
jgi:hypothetical protein